MDAACIWENTEKFSGAADWLTYMYGDTQGFITRAVIRGGYRQWHFDKSNLALQEYDGENIYVSMNSFFKTYRRTSCIKRLNALYIDIDCYKLGLSKRDALSTLDKDIFGKAVPVPTFVIDSGRGLYLIWKLHEDVNALPRWKRVMRYLYERTKALGADPAAVEPCRILRAPFSVNAGSGTQVKILRFCDRTYTLHEILRDFNIRGSNKKKSQGRSIPPLKNPEIQKLPGLSKISGQRRSLLSGRIKDLEKLYENRRGPDCRRENGLFLLRHWYCLLTGDPEFALRRTLEFNAQLDSPHDEKYVAAATASAEKKAKNKEEYRYSNARLIEFLEITPDEAKRLSFIKDGGAQGAGERKKEKNRRAYLSRLTRHGQSAKADKLSERRAAMKEMLDAGKGREEICAALGISASTYKRDKAVIALGAAVTAAAKEISNAADKAAAALTAAAGSLIQAVKAFAEQKNNPKKREENPGSNIKPLYYEEQRSCSVPGVILEDLFRLPHREELSEPSSP